MAGTGRKIAEAIPGRSDVQCLHRWQQVLNPELFKGPWTKEEDDCTKELVEKHGCKKWSLIAKHLTGRIGKQCRERSLFACKPIRAGDCILKIPLSAVMAPDNLDPSIDYLLGEDADGFTKVALNILQHKRLGQASEWAPYLNCLPRFADMHSTIFWSDEELQMIKTSSVYEATLNHKARIEDTFTSIKHVLNRFPEYFDGVTLHEFKHAYNLVESRASMSPRGASMIPFADFLNHDPDTKQCITYVESEQVIKLTAAKDYAPGDEILVNYGRLENSTLLLIFGCIFSHNKYDQPLFKIYAPQQDPLIALKRDLFNRSVLKMDYDNRSPKKSFLVIEEGEWREIPERIRALARVLCCTSHQELQELAMEAAGNDGRLATTPLKNMDRELEAHRFLHSHCVCLIEKYQAALKPLTHLRSGNETRRMQLARDLLIEELRTYESAAAWLNDYCETLKQTGSVETEVKNNIYG